MVDSMKKIAIILLALLALCSCELFELRDSQDPTEDAAWNDPATTVELALQNLEYAYEDSRNAVNYSRIFLEDYRFYFAAQDITEFSTDSEWSRKQEQDMLLNLHSRYSSITIELETMATPDEIGASEARIYRSYRVRAIPVSASEAEIVLQGNLELDCRRLYDRWYINKWYDYRSSSANTWGWLKHENS